MQKKPRKLHGGDIYRHPGVIDFSVNTNPLGTPESVKRAVQESVAKIEHYPDVRCEALREAISRFEQVNMEEILCGNGAAELFFAAVQAVWPQKALVIAPSFSEYEEALRSVGAEVEYIDLYDLNFTGCRSCMLCKRKDVKRCYCYWKDELSPIIDKVFSADALFIGTPIYFGRPTSQYFAFMERLLFSMLSYDDYSNYFKGKVNVGMFVTMNATQEFYDKMYKIEFEHYMDEFRRLNGDVVLYPCYNTLQVSDYSKFNMSSFDENVKKKTHDELFPMDLQNAYNLGSKLSR